MSVLERESFTQEQAAAIAGVHASTISRWIKSGKLPAHRFGERYLRIYREDLEALLVPMNDAAKAQRETAKALAAVDELEAHIRAVVDAAPELTPEQVDRLAAIVGGR